MKNLFKFGFFILAISLSSVACNSNKSAEKSNTDSAAVKPLNKAAAVDPTTGCD